MEKLTAFEPWALVTGASHGIGKGFSIQLAAQGLNVVLLARRTAPLKDLASHLQQQYQVGTRPISADLSKVGYLDELEKRTADLDIGLVVSKAGAGVMGAFVKNDRSVSKLMLHLNVITQMEIAHLVAARLLERREKSGILLMSLVAALVGASYSADYSGAKAYIICLGESLNYEFRTKNILVSVLIPGPTHTPGFSDRTGIGLRKLPGKVMEPSDVAREGLEALLSNKATRIAGRHNRITTRLLTRKLLPRIVGRAMEKSAPDRLVVWPSAS